jgi:pilus assembly protein CpaB
VTAALATFGIYRVLQASKAQNRVITRPVVIAFKDVSEGKAIDRASVTVAEWPVNTIPAGAYASVDSVVNRVTRVDVFRGEVIVPGRLAPDGTGPGLQVKINPGKRALSVKSTMSRA